ncbi:hypothetical protein VDGD_07179 [Verticillium dahliae]|nr:hypothetical protein VDGD_07179 [Verticillium dahliae]
MSAPAPRRMFLYPDPVRAPNVPQRKDGGPNPRIYGWFLVAAAFFMENVGFIRRAAWKNAKFGSLRDIWDYIVTVEPRHDPAVFPLVDDASHAEVKPADHAELEGILDQHQFARKSSMFPNTAAYYRSQYLSGELTPLDVAHAILPLIRRDTSPPGEHSVAWIEVHAELVLRAAEASTIRYNEKRSLGPLDGVPTAVKDEYDVLGYRTSQGGIHDYAEFLEVGPGARGNVGQPSWCVSKLEEAGAVIYGKLSLHEFGMDTAGYNIFHGTPRNPYDPSYYTGGSSSGCGYAVATGIVPLSMGADGGGSIRLPASFCSVFGLKPTHGRVSFYPGQNHSGTAAVRGPIASDMRSLIALYEVTSVPDPQSFFPPAKPFDFSSEGERTKVLGLPAKWISRADPEVQKICQNLIDRLVDQKGYTVVPIDIPLVAEGQIAHALTLLTDASSLVQSTKGISPANRILLALGRTTPAWDFLLAQKLRRVLMEHLSWLWQRHPGMIIVTPTSASAGWPIRNEKELKYGISDGDQTMKTMEYVWLANYCGVPSITVPAGYAMAEGKTGSATSPTVPVGLMGTGEWCSEEALLRFGLDAEDVGRDILRHPPNWVDVGRLAKQEKERTGSVTEGSGSVVTEGDEVPLTV